MSRNKTSDAPPKITFATPYYFWYAPKPTQEDMMRYGKYNAQEKIARCAHPDQSIDTPKNFWSNFLALPMISTLPYFHQMSLMKKGLTPSWTDPVLLSHSGGVITLCFHLDCADKAVEYLLIAIISHAFPEKGNSMEEAHSSDVHSKTINIPQTIDWELVGCSLMRAKRREQGLQKEWLECSIYHQNTRNSLQEKEILDKLLDNIRSRVPDFRMTHEPKFSRLGK